MGLVGRGRCRPGGLGGKGRLPGAGGPAGVLGAERGWDVGWWREWGLPAQGELPFAPQLALKSLPNPEEDGQGQLMPSAPGIW